MPGARASIARPAPVESRLSRKIVFLASPAHPGRRNLSSSWIRPRPRDQLAALVPVIERCRVPSTTHTLPGPGPAIVLE
jgi:hypothetical protein